MNSFQAGRTKTSLPFLYPKGGMPEIINRTATETQETIKTADQTGKEVDIMKGLEIAVIIIGCGIKILEVLEEA